jgi:hypothetical protein
MDRRTLKRRIMEDAFILRKVPYKEARRHWGDVQGVLWYYYSTLHGEGYFESADRQSAMKFVRSKVPNAVFVRAK